MSRSLRDRKLPKLPTEIDKKRKLHYDGFPDLRECWAQSKTHKKHFLDHLNCAEKQQYHHQVHGCKPFDDLVERWASPQYKITFFAYYRIRGTKPPTSSYTQDLVSDKNKTLLRKLANLAIVKRFPDELNNIPDRYDDWPEHFDLRAIFAITFDEDRQEILESIEACAKRRILFRNACIRDCCKRIDTASHDTFLLVLQILRARILEYKTSTSK